MKLGIWERFGSGNAILTIDDSRGESWQVTASTDGTWRIKARPARYEGMDAVYADGAVEGSDNLNEKDNLSAAKKLARAGLYDVLSDLGIEADGKKRLPKLEPLSDLPAMPAHVPSLPDLPALSYDEQYERMTDRLAAIGIKTKRQPAPKTGPGSYPPPPGVRDRNYIARREKSGRRLSAPPDKNSWLHPDNVQARADIAAGKPLFGESPPQSRFDKIGEYCYRPLYRPASFATVPKGWSYVEVPKFLADKRSDLPVSVHPHGVISYDRPLTVEEMERFELEAV